MIALKSAQDIAQLQAGGAIMARILDTVAARVAPGVTPKELDTLAQQLIAEYKVVPAFLNYAPPGHTPYPAALCVSVNDEVVHGLPTDVPLESGDIVGLDLGIIYQQKYYLDAARTVGVGDVSPEAAKLIQVATEALRLGIAQAQPGHRIGDISGAIQNYVERQGFEVVTQLVGHGVGFAVHEEPQVPNFGRAGTGHKLEPGLVIAIEPMITIGDPTVVTAVDGWTVLTESGELSAHQEHTVAITESGSLILTK